MSAPPLDGAGLLSSIDDVSTAVREQDAGGIAVAGVVAGLDALGFVANPIGELGRAGVGWAMEYFDTLRIPLDQLCGDPVQITARADDWQRISADLGTAATALDGVRATAGTWEGTAGTGFGRTLTEHQEGLRTLSTAAREVADLVLGSASMVGTERAIVRDMIADLVVRVASWLIVWGVTALATAGTALPIAIAMIVKQVADTALTIIRRIDELATLLRQAGAAIGRLEDTIRTGLLPAAVRGSGLAEGVGLAQDAGLELGKQQAAARATGSDWDDGGNPASSG
ncbi:MULTISPECIES: WXG100 family type VII secretion target [Pseudonocardia]|uniref:Outer membrane channel protein CpnT-like N-terminal domain-containing protein n=2 Tax=Pseudonocardia TaxID=1847 RepID=A0A1Y2MSN3_PSEAH|nr:MULTISPECIES: hypothetical protein [Pseudonocardia]OSY37979.1 hypothetical protein BG845_04386 [Pseudonocardia autotrophica]TDN74640.1 hypothetical protein C8E95_3767 [Pseudonocardia autotrophica]BBG05411.1 hypothetical protein Pdca_66200 [Pseudonocardia autotrophica]GEC26419.1 hypothetical protein PSA01_34480 [Pseudonocardia saturnea]